MQHLLTRTLSFSSEDRWRSARKHNDLTVKHQLDQSSDEECIVLFDKSKEYCNGSHSQLEALASVEEKR